MALGDVYNNNEKKNYSPSVTSGYRFSNPESTIDKTSLNFTYWNKLLKVSIAPKKETEGDTIAFDHENAGNVYLSHTKALIFYKEIIRFLDEYANGKSVTNAGVNTGKEIYSMNRDGSVVKEKQTSALFMLRNGEEGFSVTIGQYGMIEVDYIRKDPTQNKFIGLTLNTYSEKPTTREVQEFMNDARTTDEELTEIIEKTEHQLDEHGSETTLLQNIDDNPNNDKAIDIDEEIEMHDGTVTTLRQEAEKYNMSPEDYIKYFEAARGDCTSDKIMVANLNIEEEREENKDLDRGEQLLEKYNR